MAMVDKAWEFNQMFFWHMEIFGSMKFFIVVCSFPSDSDSPCMVCWHKRNFFPASLSHWDFLGYVVADVFVG